LPHGHFTVLPAAVSGTWSSLEQPGHFNFIDHHSHRFGSGKVSIRNSQFLRESVRNDGDDNPIDWSKIRLVVNCRTIYRRVDAECSDFGDFSGGCGQTNAGADELIWEDCMKKRPGLA
jgi:hypothetical protein